MMDIFINAKKSGYRLVVFYVETPNVQTNKARVDKRVSQGGNSASNDEIEKTTSSIKQNVIKLIEYCDVLYMFDNSKELTQTNERLKNSEKEKVGGAFWL